MRLNLEARAIWLLITLGLGFLPCPLLSQGTRKTSYSIPVQSSMRLSEVPQIGDTVSVICTIKPSESVTRMRVSFDKLVGVEVVSGDTIVYSSAKKNEEKTFSIQVKIISSPVDLGFWTRGRAIRENKKSYPLVCFGRIRRFITDEETGQLGTEADYMALRPEYQYDPRRGKVTGSIRPTQAKHNRKRMDDLKERDSTLTDWDALYVLRDLEVLFSRYGLSGEKAVEIALKASRLIKEQGLDRNEALEKVVSRRRLWRFGIIMLAVVLEVLLLVFITQKVPFRRRRMPADIGN